MPSCTFDYVAFDNDTFDTCPPVTNGPGGWGQMLAIRRRREELHDDEETLLLLWWELNSVKKVEKK